MRDIKKNKITTTDILKFLDPFKREIKEEIVVALYIKNREEVLDTTERKGVTAKEIKKYNIEVLDPYDSFLSYPKIRTIVDSINGSYDDKITLTKYSQDFCMVQFEITSNKRHNGHTKEIEFHRGAYLPEDLKSHIISEYKIFKQNLG